MSDTEKPKVGESRPNKGNAGKGRKPGVPNKTTAQIKEAIGVFISTNADLLNDWIAEVDDPAKRIDLYFKAMEYAVPKLARMTVVSEEKPDDTPLTWGDGTV